MALRVAGRGDADAFVRARDDAARIGEREFHAARRIIEGVRAAHVDRMMCRRGD